MKPKLLLVTFFISTLSFGQVWIDDNAVWTYKILDNGNPGFYEFKYTKDTLILGHDCQEIQGKRQLFYWNETEWVMIPSSNFYNYTYVSGDTVFYYTNEQFYMLYNFGASIGDQWLIADFIYSPLAMCKDSSIVEVIDIGTMEINAASYRTITLKSLDSSAYELDGIFVERFGFIPDSSRFRMFPFPQSCNPSYVIQRYYVDFMCFHDDSFELYNPSGEDCLFDPNTLGINKNEQSPTFAIYPNPAADFITIESNSPGKITVFDQFGRIILNEDVENKKTIAIHEIAAGTYYILFATSEDKYDVQTIMIRK